MNLRNLNPVAVIIPTLFLLCYLFLLNHVSLNEVGVAYDSFSGKVSIQQTGWHVTSPMTRTISLPTTPISIHIPSMAMTLNKKIVRLNTNGIQDFIKLQGFGYSLSASYDSIMMGYGFSGKKFSFLDIIQEGGEENLIK